MVATLSVIATTTAPERPNSTSRGWPPRSTISRPSPRKKAVQVRDHRLLAFGLGGVVVGLDNALDHPRELCGRMRVLADEGA